MISLQQNESPCTPLSPYTRQETQRIIKESTVGILPYLQQIRRPHGDMFTINDIVLIKT